MYPIFFHFKGGKGVATALGAIAPIGLDLTGEAIQINSERPNACKKRGSVSNLTSIEADIPTIVMTGNLDETTRNIVEKHPIIDYITKENKQAYQYLEKQLARLPRNEQILVLVVDDSAATRHHICNLLTRHKYQTIEAVDGVDALKVLAHPKLVSKAYFFNSNHVA